MERKLCKLCSVNKFAKRQNGTYKLLNPHCRLAKRCASLKQIDLKNEKINNNSIWNFTFNKL
ncbi:hypothetical protein JCM21142_94001 [Saccharicrinis fermentans DSM 9555 = JCM 21142]|uniref:Uncharacterized protein n=1 Tax=Saccharicrinis fermentans DSM 9555 = JCM 21142 TaxID=869213 RepID=W7YS50_9BACT|nr:hypothetical protein JCM21142_94001 [Saccharicrinis fermentans DSM 9555 = JCM 21142]